MENDDRVLIACIATFNAFDHLACCLLFYLGCPFSMFTAAVVLLQYFVVGLPCYSVLRCRFAAFGKLACCFVVCSAVAFGLLLLAFVWKPSYCLHCLQFDLAFVMYANCFFHFVNQKDQNFVICKSRK